MKCWLNAGFLEVDQLVPIARAAEEFGYEGVTLPDHLFLPAHIDSAYPYSTDGAVTWDRDAPWPDCWVAIAAMAQATRRLRFGTSVYVGPLRDVAALAKAVGTAAVLAPGRIVCGLGAGWLREEFDAVGQDFDTRGKRLDEMLEVLPRLWSGEDVVYRGDHVVLPMVRMRPAAGSIPILIGGNTAPALRRAAGADGWIGAFTDLDELTGMIGRYRARRAELGRADMPSQVLVTATPGIVKHRAVLDDVGVSGVVVPVVTLADTTATDAVVAGMERFAARWSP